MRSYSLNSNIYYYKLDGCIAVSDFNQNKIYIMSRGVSLIWDNIINGYDFESMFSEENKDKSIFTKIINFLNDILEKKIITKSHILQKHDDNTYDKIASIPEETVFNIQLEDDF